MKKTIGIIGFIAVLLVIAWVAGQRMGWIGERNGWPSVWNGQDSGPRLPAADEIETLPDSVWQSLPGDSIPPRTDRR